MHHGGMAFIFGLPEAPTTIFVACLVVVVVWLLWRDSAPVRSLQQEVENLRKSLAAQSARHAKDMADINRKMAELEDENIRQRSMKHKLSGDLAKAVVALDLVRRLADECICERQPLAPLKDVITRVLDDIEADAHRRAEDMT